MIRLHAKKWLLASMLLVAFSSQGSATFSLENLERERAALLNILLDKNLSVEQRIQKQTSIYRRLVDVERMVLRDERIANGDKTLIKRAFANYDLTFLVHASAEKNAAPLPHWLNQMGISQQAIDKGRVGQR